MRRSDGIWAIIKTFFFRRNPTYTPFIHTGRLVRRMDFISSTFVVRMIIPRHLQRSESVDWVVNHFCSRVASLRVAPLQRGNTYIIVAIFSLLHTWDMDDRRFAARWLCVAGVLVSPGIVRDSVKFSHGSPPPPYYQERYRETIFPLTFCVPIATFTILHTLSIPLLA